MKIVDRAVYCSGIRLITSVTRAAANTLPRTVVTPPTSHGFRSPRSFWFTTRAAPPHQESSIRTWLCLDYCPFDYHSSPVSSGESSCCERDGSPHLSRQRRRLFGYGLANTRGGHTQVARPSRRVGWVAWLSRGHVGHDAPERSRPSRFWSPTMRRQPVPVPASDRPNRSRWLRRNGQVSAPFSSGWGLGRLSTEGVGLVTTTSRGDRGSAKVFANLLASCSVVYADAPPTANGTQ